MALEKELEELVVQVKQLKVAKVKLETQIEKLTNHRPDDGMGKQCQFVFNETK